MPDYDLIAILGPTASGKTPFAAALAAELNTEIISADSRQIYRSMDLGTGKDLADYIVNGRQVPYHLIDIADPGYKYNVFEYQRDFLTAYESIILDDGTRFEGESFGYDGNVAGEVVFNTAMTGYPESLTDPSYAGQLMTLTYPLVGNYGVPSTEEGSDGIAPFMESDRGAAVVLAR